MQSFDKQYSQTNSVHLRYFIATFYSMSSTINCLDWNTTGRVNQCCHDPGLTGSDPDGPSCGLTFVTRVTKVKGRVRKFYIWEVLQHQIRRQPTELSQASHSKFTVLIHKIKLI